MMSSSRAPPRPRRKVSRWPASATLPGCPGSAVPATWPTARLSSSTPVPSATIAEILSRGISRRPSTSFSRARARRGRRAGSRSGGPMSSDSRSEASSRFEASAWKARDSESVLNHTPSSTNPTRVRSHSSQRSAARGIMGRDRASSGSGPGPEANHPAPAPAHRVGRAPGERSGCRRNQARRRRRDAASAPAEPSAPRPSSRTSGCGLAVCGRLSAWRPFPVSPPFPFEDATCAVACPPVRP